MKKTLGIDLGTTYSCVAYVDEFEKPVVLKNIDGDLTTPSVAFMESEDNIIVGTEAKRSLETDSDLVVQFIKRKMGKDDDKVFVGNKEYSATFISSLILKKLVEDANADLKQTGVIEENENIKDVVITCPAYFGMNERDATKKAGEIAGLNVLNILNEPTAAAISYGISVGNSDENVLVFDLGGGTFDITVMKVIDNNIEVICTGGEDVLGGKDWDEAFINYIAQRYAEETGADIYNEEETISGLYLKVEEWKKSLSQRESVKISVRGEAGRIREDFTREQFDDITKDLLLRTKNLLDSILVTSSEKGCPKSDITKVLLVGGSTKMPQVAEMLKRDYNFDAEFADPDQSVAKGAAIYAVNEKKYKDFVAGEARKVGKTVEELEIANSDTGELDKKFSELCIGQEKHIQVQNVMSRTYGVGTFEAGTDHYYIRNILKINSKLPAKNEVSFCTRSDNQGGSLLDIYESFAEEDAIELDGKKPITLIDMKFKETVPKGTGLDIELSLDNSGLLHVHAVETLNNSVLDTNFRLSNQMSDEDIDKAKRIVKNTNVE